jgi:hypothetical protein
MARPSAVDTVIVCCFNGVNRSAAIEPRRSARLTNSPRLLQFAARRGLAPRLVIVLVVIAFVGPACQSDDSGRTGPGSAADPDDKLAIVTRRGTLLLPTDIAYPPASFAVKSAARRRDTECAENDLTGPEVDGYDVAVSKAVAAALGLEPCFVTPTFTEQLVGNGATAGTLPSPRSGSSAAECGTSTSPSPILSMSATPSSATASTTSRPASSTRSCARKRSATRPSRKGCLWHSRAALAEVLRKGLRVLGRAL